MSEDTVARTRFPVMDGLRGVASLCVVMFHSASDGMGLPSGMLAVDLFFIMSGFVVDRAYGAQLSDGTLPLSRFLKTRFVRLYPMAFAGAVGGIMLAVIHNHTNPAGAFPLPALVMSGAASLLVLPWFGSGLELSVFSFNAPMWSLFFEAVANLVYGVARRRSAGRRTPSARGDGLIGRDLAVPLLVICLGLAGQAATEPIGGAEMDNFLYGFPRVATGFGLGVLLHRLWQRHPHLRREAGLLPLSIVALAIFALPVSMYGPAYFVALSALVGIVWLAAGRAASAHEPRLAAILGEISYPVYLLHRMSYYAWCFLARMLFDMDEVEVPSVGLTHLALVPLIGLGAVHFYERPARRWLGRRLGLSGRARGAKVGEG